MLADEVETEGLTPEGLARRYVEALADAVDVVGRERAVGAADEAAVEAIESGDADAVSLRDAAAILAERDGGDADAIAVEARDRLLLGMSSAVLDVEGLAAALETELDPKEIQAKIEGRLPASIAEYARLRHAVERA